MEKERERDKERVREREIVMERERKRETKRDSNGERERVLERERDRETGQRERIHRERFKGEKITKNVLKNGDEAEEDRQRVKRGRYFPYQENYNQRGRESVFLLSLDLCHLK